MQDSQSSCVSWSPQAKSQTLACSVPGQFICLIIDAIVRMDSRREQAYLLFSSPFFFPQARWQHVKKIYFFLGGFLTKK